VRIFTGYQSITVASMEYCLAGFNGQRPDPVSGHSHLGNGYRAYNPVLGRFTAPDSMSPFGAGGINPYAYCAGDPVNRADPSGHFSLGQGLGMALGLVGGFVLGVLTEGMALPVVASLLANMAGDAAIGALSELATEAVDGQQINGGKVGMAALVNAGFSLAGFGLGRLSKLKGTSNRPFGGLMLEESGATGTVSFFRVDVAPPSVVLRTGLHGNNTPRVVKLYGDDTVFAARTLEGIDAFKNEVATAANFNDDMFGNAGDYYFEKYEIRPGYWGERPKTLYLYKINLRNGHQHEVLSDYFANPDNVKKTFLEHAARQHDIDISQIDMNVSTNLNALEEYRVRVQNYAKNYTMTQEVHIKGPISPADITYISPSQIPFL
jgi:RHS repeat-associated protein